jgi:hypothetical protein
MNETQSGQTAMVRKEDDCADEERREALKKLGKYAIYTAPAMLALLLPNHCRADCRSSPEECP